MKSYWSTLFSFSRKERNGILVLFILLILLLTAGQITNRTTLRHEVDFTDFRYQAALLAAATTDSTDTARPPSVQEPVAVRPKARGIPFQEKAPRADSDTRFESSGRNRESRTPRDTPCREIELNTADSAALLPLRGIGPVLSSRIVRYRERLGGFHAVEQLLEVYGLDTQSFYGFRDCLRVDTTLVQKINLNTAGFGELRRLPYWSFAQIKVILNYREQHGLFSSTHALYNIHALNRGTIQKVMPYLRIETNQKKE